MTTILFFRTITNNATKETMHCSCEPRKVFREFYNHLEDDFFLGNELLSDSDNEVSDHELMSSDDSSNDDNTEEIGDLENDSDVREIYAPGVPRKQKFVNIDETTALDNFGSLPSQGQNVFQYSYAKGTFVMNWYTDKNV